MALKKENNGRLHFKRQPLLNVLRIFHKLLKGDVGKALINFFGDVCKHALKSTAARGAAVALSPIADAAADGRRPVYRFNYLTKRCFTGRLRKLIPAAGAFKAFYNAGPGKLVQYF